MADMCNNRDVPTNKVKYRAPYIEEEEEKQPANAVVSIPKSPDAERYIDFFFGKSSAYDSDCGCLQAHSPNEHCPRPVNVFYGMSSDYESSYGCLRALAPIELCSQQASLSTNSPSSAQSLDSPQSCFPFHQLSLELRNMIFKYFIEPFRNTDKNGLIGIQFNGYRDDFFDPATDHYPFDLDMNLPVRPNCTIPSRPGFFLVGNAEYEDRSIPKKDFQNLYNLSQVNRRFRRELNDLFWKNVCISVRYTKDFLHALEDFILHQPAIMRRIRRISMMKWTGEESLLPSQWVAIIDNCNYIAESYPHIELEVVLEFLTGRGEVFDNPRIDESRLMCALSMIKIKELKLWVHLFFLTGPDYTYEELEGMAIEGVTLYRLLELAQERRLPKIASKTEKDNNWDEQEVLYDSQKARINTA